MGMWVLMGVLGLMALPVIPPEVKSPIMLIGIGLSFGLIFILNAVARVEASKYIPIKARIMPWRIEKTFLCEKPIGEITSNYHQDTHTYVTPWRLGKTVKLPIFGKINAFEIEHTRPWTKRCMGANGNILYLGEDVENANVTLVELWLMNRSPRVEDLAAVPRFFMRSGSEDYWLLRGNPVDETELLGAIQ